MNPLINLNQSCSNIIFKKKFTIFAHQYSCDVDTEEKSEMNYQPGSEWNKFINSWTWRGIIMRWDHSCSELMQSTIPFHIIFFRKEGDLKVNKVERLHSSLMSCPANQQTLNGIKIKIWKTKSWQSADYLLIHNISSAFW